MRMTQRNKAILPIGKSSVCEQSRKNKKGNKGANGNGIGDQKEKERKRFVPLLVICEMEKEKRGREI